MKPICRIQHLSLGHAKRNLLSQWSATIHAGELVALIGRNGTGKTTLLKTLAGLHSPESGEVWINEKNIHSLTPAERAHCTSLVVSVRHALPSVKVHELVEMGRFAHQGKWSFANPNDEPIALQALQDLKLEHLSQQSIQTLSDGELQKAMIARALVQKAPLMLLDEPTAFLDFVAKEELLVLLQELAQREQMAILFSTHDLALARKYAHREWTIENGAVHER